MSCKCKKHEECEECPEWIFTFADLVMLMMGFFVILWVLKPTADPQAQDQPAQAMMTDDYLETIGEIRRGFGWQPDPYSSDPVDRAMIQKRQRQQGPGEGGETTLRPTGAQGTDPEVTSIRPGSQAAVGGRILFDPASADLLPSATRQLDQVARLIRGHRNIFLVKGHTAVDDLPADASAEQKMDLSLRRAQVVADHLTAQGVEPEILRVVGCSTFEPVLRRAYTDGTRLLNRRVEVEATTTLVEQMQDTSQTAPATLPAPAPLPAPQP